MVALLAASPALGTEPDSAGPWDDDAASIVALRTLTGHEGWVRCLAFSTDGALLISGGADSKVRLWRMPHGEPLATLAGHFR